MSCCWWSVPMQLHLGLNCYRQVALSSCIFVQCRDGVCACVHCFQLCSVCQSQTLLKSAAYLSSQIALFSMPRLISGINFHFYFVNQFHLFMLTSIHPSVLHSPHPSPLHSVTLNSKLTFLVNLFPHRSLTIDTSDWLPRLMGPFSVFTIFVGVISCFWFGRQNYLAL